MKTLIKNCKVFNSDKTELYIDGEKFVDAFSESEADEVIDLGGKMVFPGLVDMHVHLREPGYEYRETIETGCKAAAKGGFTSVCSMPNTFPVCDNAAVVNGIVKKAENAACRVYPIGAANKGLGTKEIAEIGLMKEAGIVAVSNDGKPIANAGIMRKVLEYASDFDMPVLNHCEDDFLSEGAMNEGSVSTSIGIRGIPTAAEDIMISRDLILAEYLDTPVHICHVSTKGGVRMIRDAKARGVKVTCETCPHYFTLTDKACENYDTNFKMHPPLRTQEHVDAIIEGLKDGTIDCIVTDHAPHHQDEKELEFSLANNGIVGFETSFALTYTYLVKPGHITLEKLVDLMCKNPSNILSLGRGGLDIGDDADIAVFDLENEFVFDKNKMLTKGRNTPYDGYKLYGETYLTIMGGNVTYEKVTKSLTDWSGDYLIVYENNNVAFDGSLDNLDATPNTFNVTISTGTPKTITLSDADAAAKQFIITAAETSGEYYIQAAGGKYIWGTSSNGISSNATKTSAKTNTIAWANNVFTIKGKDGSKTLTFNTASNQLRFRFYKILFR